MGEPAWGSARLVVSYLLWHDAPRREMRRGASHHITEPAAHAARFAVINGIPPKRYGRSSHAENGRHNPDHAAERSGWPHGSN